MYINESMPPEEIGLFVATQFVQGLDYVHLEGLPFSRMDGEKAASYIRSVSRAIGELSLSTQDPASDIWRLDTTTSPSTGRIPYHTDNPFYAAPERIIGFWSVISSARGGENTLLPAADIFDWASSSPEALDLIQELSATAVEFTGAYSRAVAPILDATTGTVRFDSRYAGSGIAPLTRRFSQLLEGETFTGRAVKLAAGDVLFFDNHRLLHAREPYSGADRASYRVRIIPSFAE